MGLFHTVTLQDVGKTVKEDSSENNTLHIINSPRFTLLAPLKPIFGIGTQGQKFGYRSQVMYFDPVVLLMNSFDGTRRAEMQ